MATFLPIFCVHAWWNKLPPTITLLAFKVPCLFSCSSLLGAFERGKADPDIGEAVCCCSEKKSLLSLGLNKRPEDVVLMIPWPHSDNSCLVANYSTQEGGRESEIIFLIWYSQTVWGGA
jgi:hypothetical protein